MWMMHWLDVYDDGGLNAILAQTMLRIPRFT